MPAPSSMSDLYDTDVLAWSRQQSELLRRLAAGERVNDKVDWPNVIEEIDSVGRSELRAVTAAFKNAMLPAGLAERSGGTALAGRDTEPTCPGAQGLPREHAQEIEPELPDAYRLARLGVEGHVLDEGPPAIALPDQCPWTLGEDVFAVQDEITTAVVAAIVPVVADAELRRALRKPPESLGAWEAYQRGLWHFAKANREDNEQAQQFLQRAVSLDASFAPAYVGMAMTLHWEGFAFATRPMQECRRLGLVWAQKAVELDPNDADARVMLAWSNAFGGYYSEEVRDGMSLAVALNPNSAWANSGLGAARLFSGQPSQGRHALLAALRLNPRDPMNAVSLSQIALSYYFERDHAKAAEVARRVVAQFPGMPLGHRNLAASLGQLGHADARAALQRAIEVSPQSFDLYVRSRPPWFRPEDHEHLLDGLRKAGWEGDEMSGVEMTGGTSGRDASGPPSVI
jgi:hypothetical protein